MVTWRYSPTSCEQVTLPPSIACSQSNHPLRCQERALLQVISADLALLKWYALQKEQAKDTGRRPGQECGVDPGWILNHLTDIGDGGFHNWVPRTSADTPSSYGRNSDGRRGVVGQQHEARPPVCVNAAVLGACTPGMDTTLVKPHGSSTSLGWWQ